MLFPSTQVFQTFFEKKIFRSLLVIQQDHLQHTIGKFQTKISKINVLFF